jgi:hypothetical protein
VKKLIRGFLMKPLAHTTSDSTMYWMENDLQYRISAFFRDKARWQAIPSQWADIRRPDFQDYRRLSHGYDESLSDSALDLSQMQQAARFRGGSCTSGSMEKGDLFTPLNWQCWRGHVFAMTPNAVLKGGHWCPECEPARNGWDYDQEARNNPFFAQVWYNNHDVTEANYYPPDCYLDVAAAR